MKKRYIVSVCVGALLFCSTTAMGATFNFTDDADWDQGIYTSTNSGPPGTDNQIQIDPNVLTQFSHIWVALSGRDGVARINTNHVDADGYVSLAESAAGNGAVYGEYLSRPDGMAGNPSRTTTDLNGDVWVGNRDEAGGGKGSVTKISANPTGTTSSGVWNGSTFNRLDWNNSGSADSNGGTSTAIDTAITNYVRTTSPNVRAVAVDANNDVWVGGYTTHHHELIDGNTGATVGGTGNSFDINEGGYGALVDGNGVVWSADWPTGTSSRLVRHDPLTNTTTVINPGRSTYGLGIDNSGNVWVANWTYNTVQKYNPAGVLQGTFATGTSSNRGVALTPDNNIWVAGSGSNKIARLDNNGNLIGTINVGATPTGVAVDSNGKVWVTNYGSDTVMRIDPNIGQYGAVDLTIYLGSNANPYNYSDMTGTVVGGTTNPTGTWRVVQDSGVLGQEWDQIFWNDEAEGVVHTGTSLTIMARAANTMSGLNSATYSTFSYGDYLGLFGQFLEVKTVLTRDGSDPNALSPILSDLTFSTKDGTDPVPEPATMLLFGTGLAALTGMRMKRKKS